MHEADQGKFASDGDVATSSVGSQVCPSIMSGKPVRSFGLCKVLDEIGALIEKGDPDVTPRVKDIVDIARSLARTQMP